MTFEEGGAGGPVKALDEALARMTWSVDPETFALASFPRSLAAQLPVDLGAHAQVTLEPDGLTVLASAAILEPLLARFPGARVEVDLAWVRFDTAMGWEVVGFLAAVCGRLAQAGVPLGAVCSFDRDHLFIARRYLARVGPVLDGLFGGGAGATSDGQIR